MPGVIWLYLIGNGGHGLEQDRKQAASLLNYAAQHRECPDAMYNAANILTAGECGIRQNVTRTFELYKIAVEEHSSVYAMTKLPRLLLNRNEKTACHRTLNVPCIVERMALASDNQVTGSFDANWTHVHIISFVDNTDQARHKTEWNDRLRADGLIDWLVSAVIILKFLRGRRKEG